MRKKYKIPYLIILTILLFACNSSDRFIPYVRLDIHYNIISELGNPLPGNFVLMDGGVNGLIVYCEAIGEYHVYDRTCRQYPEHNKQVEKLDDFEGIFECPECQSRYWIEDGAYPLQGPATFSLHEYLSVVQGDLLHVYN